MSQPNEAAKAKVGGHTGWKFWRWLSGSMTPEEHRTAIRLDGRHRQFHRSGRQHGIRFAMTREGFHFGFLIVFVLVGAIIRNVNLLVVLAGILIGMLFLQWRLCRRTLFRLSLVRKVPLYAQARRPFRVTLQVRNPKTWLGAWNVLIQDRLLEIDRNGSPLSEGYRMASLVSRVPPKSMSSVDYECTCVKRGLVEFGPVQISTIFPWGLLRGYGVVEEADQCMVHPTLGSLKHGWRELFEVRRHGAQQSRSQAGSSEGEFYGLRSYRVGDSPKWIHWRTTARRNEPVVRQFERQENVHASVLLDLHRPSEEAELVGHEAMVDTAVEFVATLAQMLVGRGGGTLSVAIAADSVSYMEKIQSRNQVLSLMDELAVVQSTTGNDWEEGVHSLAYSLRANPLLLVVSTRSNQWNERVVRERDPIEWVMQRVHARWLNVAQGDLQRYFERNEV